MRGHSDPETAPIGPVRNILRLRPRDKTKEGPEGMGIVGHSIAHLWLATAVRCSSMTPPVLFVFPPFCLIGEEFNNSCRTREMLYGRDMRGLSYVPRRRKLVRILLRACSWWSPVISIMTTGVLPSYV